MHPKLIPFIRNPDHVTLSSDTDDLIFQAIEWRDSNEDDEPRR